MTEQEAIQEIKRWTGILMNAGSQYVMDTAEAQGMAISALEEIRQYRELDDKLQTEIGITVKGLYEEWNVMLAEYLEYNRLGTVEEMRDAKEKRIPMKPKSNDYYNWQCPDCGVYRSTNGKYCSNCGQAIDWGE